MEEKKNGKGLVVVLVLFILISLGLGGYIVYDKALNKDENTNDNKVVNKNEKKELDINSLLVQSLYNTFRLSQSQVMNVDDLNNSNLLKLRLACDNISSNDFSQTECSKAGHDDGAYCASNVMETEEGEKAYASNNIEKFLEIVDSGNARSIASKKLELKVHELFGSDYEYKAESFGLDHNTSPSCHYMKYVKDIASYVEFRCEGGGTGPVYEQELVSAYLKNDKLYIVTTYNLVEDKSNKKEAVYEFKKDKELGNYVFVKIEEK